MRVYLDTCIVVYMLEGPRNLQDRIEDLLAREEVEVIVSDLVRMECLIKPLRERNEDLVVRFERFFSVVKFVPFESNVFDLAADLRAFHRLSTPDALHLAACLRGKCSEFWTNDDQFQGLPVASRVRLISSDPAP